MKRLLLLSLLAVFVVAVPAQAHAAAPCRDKVFNDWYADGKISSAYPHACYVDALRHIPADADEYSSLREDITAAMRAGIEHSAGQVVPKQVGHGFAPHNVLVSGTQSTKQSAPHDPAPSTSSPSSASSQDPPPSGQTANAAVASSSSGAPLPVLALGALALALVAAGALGAGVKHARSRRR